MSRAAVLQRAMPSRKRALPALVFGVFADGSAVGLLALSMWLLVKSGEQPPILHLTFAIVGVRALALGRAAFRYVERLASHDAALAQLATLRADTFAALVPRVPGAIEESRRGDVLATFVDDVDQLQDEPLRVRQPFTVSLVVTGLTLIMVALVNPAAALALLIVLATSGGAGVLLSRWISARSDRELSEARAALTDALLDRFESSEVLAAFYALGAQRDRIARAEEHLARVQLTRTRASGLTGAITALGAGVASIAMLLLLAPSVTGQDAGLSAPIFAAVVVVPAAVFEVFGQVFAAFSARRTVSVSADRVAALTDAELPPELPRDPAPRSTPVLRGAQAARDADRPLIDVRDLSVAYPGGVTPVTGVSFRLHAGEVMLVTGESGAGKSTLALALARFLDYRGSYRVSGVEARDLGGEGVRSIVGLCEQRPYIFDSDLRQNLKFARDTASDNELLDVLHRVGLGEWAERRGGLDAQLGERGALISGGQAQRISLARAILADFPVVILDEPTAGVDQKLADALLSDLLVSIPGDRAVIVISHTKMPAGISIDSLLEL